MNFITELDYKIGQNIKSIRIKLNLSSLHLGDYLNVSSSFICSGQVKLLQYVIVN